MSYDRLKSILAQPSVSFREEAVARAAASLLTQHAIPHFFDPHGNLVVGAGTEADYFSRLEATTGPALPLFIAHMDHPGFHGVSWNKKGELLAEWLGGGPTQSLEGATVWLAEDGRSVGSGKVVKAKTKGRRIVSLTVRPVEGTAAELPAEKLGGGFSFKEPVWKKGDLVFTKAADDLVGAYCILELALRCKPGSFLGLLTRAEEVGFIGMIHHFDDVLKGRFRESLLCVSLETSKALPGAEIGKGPVVRLGDRSTVFDPAGVEWLTHIARQVLGKRFQRRVMDGGTCEATVAVAEGYRTAGISVPLGNYHNECFFKKFPKEKLGGPAPEFVSWRDVQGLLTLAQGLVENPFSVEMAWTGQRASFHRYKEQFKGKMAKSFGV